MERFIFYFAFAFFARIIRKAIRGFLPLVVVLIATLFFANNIDVPKIINQLPQYLIELKTVISGAL